jgi:hypothetical protein
VAHHLQQQQSWQALFLNQLHPTADGSFQNRRPAAPPYGDGGLSVLACRTVVERALHKIADCIRHKRFNYGTLP